MHTKKGLLQQRKTGDKPVWKTVSHKIKTVCIFISWPLLITLHSILTALLNGILIKRYSGDEGQNIKHPSMFLGFGSLHYSLIRNIKPKHILCIGSRKGFVPSILALACQHNNFGHVDFVDPGYDIRNKGKNWSGVGFWKKPLAKYHFQTIHLQQWISLYVMTTEEFILSHQKGIYEYIYIDGDHSYEGVKKDFMLLWPKLRKHGLMVFHDVVAKGTLDNGKFGVKKFWKELKIKEKIIFPFPKTSGLGIIQKIYL